jgi:transposase
MQHFLYFLPLPQAQGSFRPILAISPTSFQRTHRVYQAVLADAKFHEQLLVFDRDLAASARAARCWLCGGVLPMRFVPVKTAEQQAALMLVGVRDRLIRNRTQLANTIRGYAAEFGLTAAKGMAHLIPLLERIEADESLPALARELFAIQAKEYTQLEAQIDGVDAKLMTWFRANECSRRLAKIPGVGPIGAVMLQMKTPEPDLFRSGRQFAAWIGLTPKGLGHIRRRARHDPARPGRTRRVVGGRAHSGRRRSMADRRSSGLRAQSATLGISFAEPGGCPTPGWANCPRPRHSGWGNSHQLNHQHHGLPTKPSRAGSTGESTRGPGGPDGRYNQGQGAGRSAGSGPS